MILSDRQFEILDEIKKKGSISIRKIVQQFYVSESTARRDLTVLEKYGVIQREFGGAVITFGGENPIPRVTREKEDIKEKKQLCELAKDLVHNGDTVFLDSSSTIQPLIYLLKDKKNIIIVTNGITVTTIAGELNIKVYCACGEFIFQNMSFAGRYAEDFIDNFNADICFFTSSGINERGIISDPHLGETLIRKHFIANSKKKIFMATKNKFNKTFSHTLCTLKDVDEVISQVSFTENINSDCK